MDSSLFFLLILATRIWFLFRVSFFSFFFFSYLLKNESLLIGTLSTCGHCQAFARARPVCLLLFIMMYLHRLCRYDLMHSDLIFLLLYRWRVYSVCVCVLHCVTCVLCCVYFIHRLFGYGLLRPLLFDGRFKLPSFFF